MSLRRERLQPEVSMQTAERKAEAQKRAAAAAAAAKEAGGAAEGGDTEQPPHAALNGHRSPEVRPFTLILQASQCNIISSPLDIC